MRGDQQAAARIDVKVAAMDAARVDMLDRGRLAGRRVDGKDGQRVLAAHKCAARVGRGGAVRDIGKTAAGMQLYRAGDLSAADVAGLAQGALAEQRLRRQGAVVEGEHVEPVLPFERDIDPGFARVEIEVARPEAVTAIWRYRRLVGQRPGGVIEHLEG